MKWRLVNAKPPKRGMKGGALKAKFYVRHMSENRLKEQKDEMCSTCKQVVGSCNMYPCVFEKWNYLCYFENSQVCYHTWHGSALCSTNGTLAGSQYQVRLEECFLSISLSCIRWGWRNSGIGFSNYWYVHNFTLFIFQFFQIFLLKCEFVLPTYLPSLLSLGVFTEAPPPPHKKNTIQLTKGNNQAYFKMCSSRKFPFPAPPYLLERITCSQQWKQNNPGLEI